jgi:hypothetical protein
MSKIEMQHSNAILAVNSLDRYITSLRTFSLTLNGCLWSTIEPTVVLWNFQGQTPVVGATVTSTGVGWPAVPVTITYVLNTTFGISQPITADNGPGPGDPVIVTYSLTNAITPTSNSLIGQYTNIEPYSNNFLISSPGALIYGYLNKLIVSQIQLFYNIPTVSFSKNDVFIIALPVGPTYVPITIPYGFYPPSDLAAALQSLINANPTLTPLNMTVTFDARDGFTFTSVASSNFYFPNPATVTGNPQQLERIYKTYRLLGITLSNNVAETFQVSSVYPNFLYTPYIDIISDVLTNYQDVKDSTTATSKFKGLIARVYLSGTGNIQSTSNNNSLGIEPFVMTADLNTPKIIQWSPDVAVPSIDFQLYDQYSELIPGPAEGFSTEFQMTLLCIEE